MAKKSKQVEAQAQVEAAQVEAQPVEKALTRVNLQGQGWYVGAPTKQGACLYLQGTGQYMYLGKDKVKGGRSAGKDRNGNPLVGYILLANPERVKIWQQVELVEATPADLESAELLYKPDELNSR
jgi:hypothetical protein